MIHRFIPSVLVFACGALLLTGCSNPRESLGLNKKAPDEFAVVKRAPLSMPPDYKLHPPQPGAPRPQELTTSNAARETVFGTAASGAKGTTTDSVLLQKAGAESADPSIRRTVDAETAQLHDRNKPVAEKLLGIGGDKDEPSASVVNAAEEAERLRKNETEGAPLTRGDTPTIEE